MLNIQIRPIKKWPSKETANPKRSQFKASYRVTLQQLEKELQMMKGADTGSLVLEMWVNPSDIRLDGQLRASVKPERLKQGLILSFNRHFMVRQGNAEPQRKVQTLSYPCDAFDDWQDNLRAITLSLESLRRVERYGVFKYDDIVNRLALPTAEGSVSTRESAAAFLAQYSGVAMKEILFSPTARATAYRKAAFKLHPDQGGDPEEFVKLQEANKTLSS